MRRPTSKDLSAGLWAVRARVAVRRSADSGLDRIVVPRSPASGLAVTGTVHRTLRATRATCLVESAVLQRWFLDHGVLKDLVVGVTAPGAGFRAHAWLEAPGQTTEDKYVEIRRLRADREP